MDKEDSDKIIKNIIGEPTDDFEEIYKRANEYFGKERIQWIYHRGKKIRFNDASGMSSEEILIAINVFTYIYANAKPGMEMRELYFLHNISYNVDIVRAVMKWGKVITNSCICGISATYGMSPIQKVFAKMARKMYIAETKEEALAWLADDSNLAYGSNYVEPSKD